jgi:hypothetical protein
VLQGEPEEREKPDDDAAAELLGVVKDDGGYVGVDVEGRLELLDAVDDKVLWYYIVLWEVVPVKRQEQALDTLEGR